MNRKLLVLLVIITGLFFFAPAAGNGRFPNPLFVDDYMTHMRRMTGSGMAEMRAENARFYTVCDAHHNCRPMEKTAVPSEMGLRKSFCWIRTVGSYPHACVW